MLSGGNEFLKLVIIGRENHLVEGNIYKGMGKGLMTDTCLW